MQARLLGRDQTPGPTWGHSAATSGGGLAVVALMGRVVMGMRVSAADVGERVRDWVLRWELE